MRIEEVGERMILGEIPTNRYTKWFDYDKIKNTPLLRKRASGDYLEAVKGKRKKLARYLIDEKIPRDQRDGCVLLADGSHIMWVVGGRISEYYKVTEDTRRILVVEKTEGGTKDGKALCRDDVDGGSGGSEDQGDGRADQQGVCG